MSVSYLSNKVIESSPYVQPVSLDILARVGTFKQGQYDANHQRIQSQIDNVVSKTQGMNSLQKEYVNNKLNSLVGGINNVGGLDLSDLNIANQIDGYASSIYGDDRVIKYMNNAASANSFSASKQKMLSDPKMMKFYSEANAWDGDKEIIKYHNSTNLDEDFNIKSSIEPWTDAEATLLKAEKNIKANLIESEIIKGVYKVKNSNETVTDEDIARMTYAAIDAKTLAQLQRDANFTYEKVYQGDKSRVILTAISNENAKINRKKNDYSKYHSLSLADPTNASYFEIKSRLKQEIDEDEKSLPIQATIFDKMYGNNREAFQLDTYVNSIVSGKIAKLAYSKETKTMSLNPFTPIKSAENIAKANLDFKDRQLKEQTRLKERELDIQESKLRGDYDGSGGGGGKNKPQDYVAPTAPGNMEIDDEDREKGVREELSSLQTQSKDMIVNYFIDEFKADPTLNLKPDEIEKIKLYFNTQIQDYNKDGVVDSKDIKYSNLDFTKGQNTEIFGKKIKLNGKEQFLGNLIQDSYRNVYTLFEDSSKDKFNYSEYRGVKNERLLNLLTNVSRMSKKYEIIQSQLAYPNLEDKEKEIEQIGNLKKLTVSSPQEYLYRNMTPNSWQVSSSELKKNKFYGNQYSEVYFNEDKQKQLSESGITNKLKESLPEGSKDVKIISLNKNYKEKDKPWQVKISYNASDGRGGTSNLQIDNPMKNFITNGRDYEYSYADDYVAEGNRFTTESILAPTGFPYLLSTIKDSNGEYRVIYSTIHDQPIDIPIKNARSAGEALESAITSLKIPITKLNIKSREQLENYLSPKK